MPEILKYFSSENECKKYILSNELYIYTYEEEYYDKFIFKKYKFVIIQSIMTNLYLWLNKYMVFMI